MRACGGERFCGRRADAAAGAGDERQAPENFESDMARRLVA